MITERRELERLLPDLGYELQRNGTHMIYSHPDLPKLVVPTTTSDRRATKNILAELRRRHPERFERRKSDRPRRAYRPRIRKRVVLVPAAVIEKPAKIERPEFTSCAQCERRWTSDVDPAGRDCPSCGGPILLGKRHEETPAQFRARMSEEGGR